VPADSGAPAGAGGAGTYRAIVYNPDADRFYVASDSLGLLVFDRLGAYVRAPARLPPGIGPGLRFHTACPLGNHRSAYREIQRRRQRAASGSTTPRRAVPARPRAVALAFCPLGALAVAFGDPRLGPHSVGPGRTYDADGKPSGRRTAQDRQCTRHGLLRARRGLHCRRQWPAAVHGAGRAGRVSFPCAAIDRTDFGSAGPELKRRRRAAAACRQL